MPAELKLLGFRIQDLGGIEVAEYDPDGRAFIVSGDNAVGKTQILNSLIWALTGERPASGVRNGKDKGEAKLTIGIPGQAPIWSVRRVMRNGKTDKLELVDANGDKQSHVGEEAGRMTAAAFLKALAGMGIAFDPQRFIDLDRKARMQTLLTAHEVDVSAIQKERDDLYSQRTAVNREVDRLKLIFQEAPLHEDAPAEEPSMQEAVEQAKRIVDLQAKHREWEHAILQATQDHANCKAEVARLEEELKKATAKKESMENTLSEWKQKEPENPSEEEVEQTRTVVAEVEAKKKKWAENQERIRKQRDWQDKKAEADALTDKIDSLDHQKELALAKATEGLPLLSIVDGDLHYSGKPFDALSGMEQTTVALDIGSKLSGHLRIVLIDEGSNLGRKALRHVFEESTKRKLQPIVARVVDDQTKLEFRLLEEVVAERPVP